MDSWAESRIDSCKTCVHTVHPALYKIYENAHVHGKSFPFLKMVHCTVL
jgi:hypothetical protein